VIRYFFTDKRGGVSEGPYRSFNLAFHVGDDAEAVRKNRAILERKVKKRVLFMNQIHSDKIISASDNLCECDAIVSDRDDLALAVMVADCVPLLMFDRHAGVIAAVHAGRAGAFKLIAKKTAAYMCERFGCDPKNIEAVMGPHIRSCCYEVSSKIAREAAAIFSKECVKRGRFLDISLMLRESLVQFGLKSDKIRISKECSCCNERYFSYRREGVTGRFAGVIYKEIR